jgi:hypothetical protein
MKKLIIAALAGLALLLVVSHNYSKRAEQSAPDPVAPLMSEPARKLRLPAPVFRSPVPAHEPIEHAARPVNWLGALLEGQWPARPKPEQVEVYLESNRRSAESLLAAYHATGDNTYLEEARQRHADHPHVAFTAFFKSNSPEESRRLIESLKQADPSNALADYLSAREHFKAGEMDLAVRDLVSANSKYGWRDYSGDFIQNAEETYLAAGYSAAEAKAMASLDLPLPHLAQLRDLGRQIGDLAGLYRQDGDMASAQAALEMGVTLAHRISHGSGPSWLIQDLVGLSAERNLLQGIDPATPYDYSGRTVNDRLSEIARKQEDLKQLGRQTEDVLLRLSEPDLILFLDRWKTSGEIAAMRWALNRQGEN